ncbi:MAG: carbohydrate-binding protein, partial [Rubrivivax sp.]
HLDGPGGPLLGRVRIDKAGDWKLSSAMAKNMPKGVRDIVITQTGGNAVEVDWVSFQ